MPKTLVGFIDMINLGNNNNNNDSNNNNNNDSVVIKQKLDKL